jgi:putative ABC transport system permease protein
VPLAVGDTLELNDHRAVVVGLCKVSRTFQSQPVIYTAYTRATTFAPRERKLLSFVQVKAKPGVEHRDLARRIAAATGLAAYTKPDFEDLTVWYFMKYTGIPINFGIAVLLGFLVGAAVAGLLFYNFTLDNLKHFAALKAMGATNLTLLRMVVLQALLVGGIGYGLGIGGAAFFGWFTAGKTELAFRLPWQVLALSGVAIALICTFAAFLSLWKVVRLEPAVVFK